MDKVICDICGSEYSKSEMQCPLCGCARSTTVSNDTQAETFVKGGRFSRSNVKKRLGVGAAPVRKTVEAEVPEEYDDDDDMPKSNWGLISIVILLLLAIIAVSTYIAVYFFDDNKSASTDPKTSSTTTAPIQRVPCTSIEFAVEKVVLNSKDSTYKIVVSALPQNTTDKPVFTSKNPAVATVDSATGTVTAVASGSTVITVSCGDIVEQISVECQFATTTAPTTKPTTPTLPQNSPYTVPADATPISPVQIRITNEYVNIRKGPATSYENLGKVYEGDVLTMYATYQTDTLEWGLTNVGWIATMYAQIISDAN